MASPLDSTMGIRLVSLFLAAILYGMDVIQTYLCLHWYTKDHWGVKATIRICETLHIALFFGGTYRDLIDNFGDFAALAFITWYDWTVDSQLLFQNKLHAQFSRAPEHFVVFTGTHSEQKIVYELYAGHAQYAPTYSSTHP
ncbi:hypothetical protein B0H14DRAFT_2586299 [Mycena olivaceomarginata]|nr:hypothetical protein B0H14DRAFT_2586299 [Mycena olivaceomarginata]